jgi:hypothetical protein
MLSISDIDYGVVIFKWLSPHCLALLGFYTYLSDLIHILTFSLENPLSQCPDEFPKVAGFVGCPI